MSEIKALDNLRKQLNVCKMHDMKPAIAYIADIADEIQAEVDERFMELPVDADGVPIHVGDELEGGFTVDYVAPHWVLAAGRGAKHEDSCHHVKPRTLEDVLADVVTLCANTWKDGESPFAFYDVSDVMESGNIREYADEIRELMKEGGDDQRD